MVSWDRRHAEACCWNMREGRGGGLELERSRYLVEVDRCLGGVGANAWKQDAKGGRPCPSRFTRLLPRSPGLETLERDAIR